MVSLLLPALILIIIITAIVAANSSNLDSMSEHTKSTPLQVFLHLLMISMLYTSIASLITLLIQYTDFLFPDQLQDVYFEGKYNAIRSASAALIVAFPVYLLSSWLIWKEYKKNPEAKEMRVRKWLVYLTLFVSAITIIVDLIQLVFNFYSGDLTLPFFIKVVDVLIVAGLVFGYYLWELNKREIKDKKPKIYAIVTGIVLLAILISGFFIVGTPSQQRQVEFDEERVQDLQMIQVSVINYWQRKEALPAKLEDMNDSISGFTAPTDPANSAVYEYIVNGDLSFTLCANFSTERKKQMTGEDRYMMPVTKGELYYGDDMQTNWAHGVGHVCFERTIDPDLYRIDSK